MDDTKERSVVDPLVKVELFGVPEDTRQQETDYVDNNGERRATGRGGPDRQSLSMLSSSWCGPCLCAPPREAK